MSAVQCEGILEEECTLHKQIEWVFKYVLPQTKEHFTLTSPEFKIGSQNYKLELSSDSSSWTNLLLYRRGPSVDCPFYYVRWWAGLKRTDGTYNDRNLKGELELKNECETWTQVTLHRISQCELQDHIIQDFLFVFFRLSLEQALATTKECSHDAAKMSAQGTGIIREQDCTSHKHVEWEVLFDRLRERKNFSSPSFMIENRTFKLELSFGFGKPGSRTIHVHLYSKETPTASPSRSIRWWAGMKLINQESVRGIHGRGMLDLKKESEIWTQKNLYVVKEAELEFLENDQKHLLFVFFRLNFERPTRLTVMCSHVPSMGPFAESNDGIIREENRSSYKHVEWEIRLNAGSLEYTRYDRICNEFVIGSQRHKLELCLDNPNFELNLYSRGPSVGPSRTARWWAGFKRSVGACILSITSGIMDLQELCELWTQKCLYSIRKDKVKDELREINGQLIIFFRMNVRQELTAAEASIEDNAEMSVAHYEGIIQEVECASYKRMEWNVISPWNPSFRSWISSPEFKISTQRFRFELNLKHAVEDLPGLCLILYSKGYSIGEPSQSLRWCAGLQRPDGTYHHKIMRGELDLTETYELWTPRGLIIFSLNDCETSQVTFFFRLKKQTEPMAAKTRKDDAVEILAKGFGKIQKREFTSYEHVEWTTDYGELKEKSGNFSPEFLIGNQRYILELLQDSNALDSMTLCLYRRGSSVAEPCRFARWWVGLKRDNGKYRHRNQRGELNLNEQCEVWTPIYLHRVCRYELERELLAPNNTLTVFFRLGVEGAATACTYDDKESLPKIKRPRSEDNIDVVFQVKDAEFKMPRAIVEARIPVYEAMFHHDNIENASGVVTIEDFEPTVFKEFLHYISVGFLREVTVRNAFDIYMIADKYLVDDLKAECLQCLSENLSVDNFCDVVTLALRHNEKDLLKEATDFLSRNKNITSPKGWEKFCSDNPTEANDLLLKAFPPQE